MDPAGIVVVPNASAARLVHWQMTARGVPAAPRCLTRDGLYDFLHATLPGPKPRLSSSDREALMRSCLRQAREEDEK